VLKPAVDVKEELLGDVRGTVWLEVHRRQDVEHVQKEA
jgi:hypothetical protein